MHGSLGYWTPELQWCGGCRLPGGDCTALRVHGNLTAVAIGLGTWLLDSRVSEPVASIAAVGAGAQRQPDLGQQQAAAAAAAVQQNREQIRWQQVAAGMLPSDDDDADDDEMLHSMQHLFGEGLVPLGRPASVPAAGFTVEATLTGGIALAEGINEVGPRLTAWHALPARQKGFKVVPPLDSITNGFVKVLSKQPPYRQQWCCCQPATYVLCMEKDPYPLGLQALKAA